MKLNARAFLVTFSASLLVLVVAIGMLLHYQSTRIGRQVEVAERSVREILRGHSQPGGGGEEDAIAVMSERLRQGARRNFSVVLTSVAVAVLVCSVVVYFFFLTVTAHLRRMASVAERIRGGDYGARVASARDDELGELARSLDAMAASIAARDEEIRASEERLRTVLHAMPVGVMVVDAEDRRIVDLNPAAEALLGTPRETAVGGDCRTWFCANRGCSCPVLDEGRTLENAELTVDRPDGLKATVLKSVTSVSIGGRRHLLESMLDVTREREARQENEKLQSLLVQSQKMEAIGMMAGGIAHDFNNLLMPVICYADMAMKELPAESRIRAYLREVSAASMRARDLVRQILAFSRRKAEDRRPIQLSKAVREALLLIRAATPRTIAIEERIADDAGTIAGDPTQIHQILMNLCTNAVHAIGKRTGTISVTLSSRTLAPGEKVGSPPVDPGRYLALAVADDGCGMPPEIASRIFEPFFTTKEADKGTGMGLSLVRGIVRGYGGSIGVESAPGAGTRFEVLLPMLEQVEDPAAVEGEGTRIPVGRGERVLLVDDDPSVLLVAGEILRHLGYAVSTAERVGEALARFRDAPDAFDLVLSDMTMPDGRGTDLVRAIREIRPAVPVVLSSGFEVDLGEDPCQTAIQGILVKPVTMREMAAAVRSALDGPQPGA